jgi:hypothetical protein
MNPRFDKVREIAERGSLRTRRDAIRGEAEPGRAEPRARATNLKEH